MLHAFANRARKLIIASNCRCRSQDRASDSAQRCCRENRGAARPGRPIPCPATPARRAASSPSVNGSLRSPAVPAPDIARAPDALACARICRLVSARFFGPRNGRHPIVNVITTGSRMQSATRQISRIFPSFFIRVGRFLVRNFWMDGDSPKRAHHTGRRQVRATTFRPRLARKMRMDRVTWRGFARLCWRRPKARLHRN